MSTTKTPDDYLVEGLENVQPAYAEFPGKMYAGLIPMDHGGRHGEMMFWLFKPDEQLVPDTFAIWLNGGCACLTRSCGVLLMCCLSVASPRDANILGYI